MGYYQMRARHNTEAGREDPEFVGIFDWARDMEYTVAEARLIARTACRLMKLHPKWTMKQAIQEVLE